MKINHRPITEKLENICRDIGGHRRDDFIPPIPEPPEPIEDTLLPLEFEKTFHSSGLLIYKGRPVFAYIRDHTNGYYDTPEERKKLHFSTCMTLEQKKQKGEYESRYRVTTREDDQYLIDIERNQERLETLYPCQHCLRKTNYRCFATQSKNEESAIIKNFNAKDAMDVLRQHFALFHSETINLKPDTAATGYVRHQKQLSERFRQKKKFVCEECGVKTKFTDMHHKDRDKRNNQYDNLQCLCKICHKKIHPHYVVPTYIVDEIQNARQQNIIN